MDKKIYLKGPKAKKKTLNKENSLQKRVEELQREVAEIQEKQAILQEFAREKNRLFGIETFTKIQGINLKKRWDKCNIKQNGYEVDEEMYLFTIQTVPHTFDVLFVYEGKEDVLNKCVYYLYTPELNEKETNLVKEAIVRHIVQKEDVLITHVFTTVQKELAPLFAPHVCQRSYQITRNIYDEEQGIQIPTLYDFKCGETYDLLVDDYFIIVNHPDGKMFHLNEREWISIFTERGEEVECDKILMRELVEFLEGSEE